LGSFNFSKFDRFLGKSALQALVMYGYSKSPKGIYDKTMLGLGTIGIWMPWARRAVATGTGWGIRMTLLSPAGLAVVVPVIVGGGVSYAIDEEDGLDNYGGFISGGLVGNEPNYSDYFNVYENVKTIWNAPRTKSSGNLLGEHLAEERARYGPYGSDKRDAVIESRIAATETYSQMKFRYENSTAAEKAAYLELYRSLLY